MPTKKVPCDECDFWRRQFEADGRIVLGCEPAEPGMCALRWELPAATAGAPAAKKAGAKQAGVKQAVAKKAAARKRTG